MIMESFSSSYNIDIHQNVNLLPNRAYAHGQSVILLELQACVNHAYFTDK